MNNTFSILLIGVGGAGATIARGVNRAFGGNLRYFLADTDATTGASGDPFLLLGGNRLSGRGSGGDMVSARLAAAESTSAINEFLGGVSVAVIVCSLGGGTGSGATLEIVQRLESLSITTIVIATTPFAFEGADKNRLAQGIMPIIQDASSCAFFMPMDKLVGDVDNMQGAFRQALDSIASAVTLFWRLVEKPGYIRLDTEKLRKLVIKAGRGRFATVTAQGANRSAEILDSLSRSPLLTDGKGPVRTVLLGILAGEDLRLSEVGRIAEGVQSAFCARDCRFEVATVNDEETFSGRLSVTLMMFEDGAGAGSAPAAAAPGPSRKSPRKNRDPLAQGPRDRGRFNNVEHTIWNNRDLDVPTFIRQGITIEQ